MMNELKKWYWEGERGMSDTPHSGIGVRPYYEAIDVDSYYGDLLVEQEKRINGLLTVIEATYARKKQKAEDKKRACASCGKEMAVEGVMYYCEDCDGRFLTNEKCLPDKKQTLTDKEPMLTDREREAFEEPVMEEMTEPAWKAIRQYINDANDPLLHDFAKALIWLKERADDERSRIILLDERIVHLEEKAKELEGDMR